MNHITSINEPFPTPQALSAATRTHAQSRFRISTRKLPISKAGPIEDLEKRIGIPMPEMIFGDNAVWVTHAPTGWTLGFSAAPALDAVDKTGEKMLKSESISDDLSFKYIGIVGRYALNFNFSDGHDTGIYSFKYLREMSS